MSAAMFMLPSSKRQDELLAFHHWWWETNGTLSINKLDSSAIVNLPIGSSAQRSLQYRRKRNWPLRSQAELLSMPGWGVDSIWVNSGAFDFTSNLPESKPYSPKKYFNDSRNPQFLNKGQQDERDLTPVSLNQADSLQLIEIKGIGPYTARKIVKYREHYGSIRSLVHMKQALFPAGRWKPEWDSLFVLEDIPSTTLSLSTTSFDSLMEFPDLNYGQVKRIVFSRESFGTVHWKELMSYEEFRDCDTNFLKLYIRD